jgi:hypothetical protein
MGLSGTVELSFNEIMLGRAMECAIRSDDPMLSRRHARIYFQDGVHVIEDMGSANGIYVGEQRVPRHVLNHGDSVRAGNLVLSYANDGQGMMAGPGGGYGGYPGQPSMAPPGPGYGQPPPAYSGPPPPGAYGAALGSGGGQPMPMPGGGAPPPPSDGFGGSSPQDWERMQRRIDQLQSEVRLLRGGGHEATRMEELEEKISRLERDKMELTERCMKLEAMASHGGGGGVQIGTAQLMLGRAEEVVNGLNDVLSELRINILAAEGEAEQWASQLPRASFDLVRDSLRSSRMQMESAKELMRLLRQEAR